MYINLARKGKTLRRVWILDYFTLWCKLSQLNLPLNYSSVLGRLHLNSKIIMMHIMIYEIANNNIKNTFIKPLFWLTYFNYAYKITPDLT